MMFAASISCAGDAEEPFDRGVGELDLPVLVGHEKPVGRVFDDAAVPRLAHLELEVHAAERRAGHAKSAGEQQPHEYGTGEKEWMVAASEAAIATQKAHAVTTAVVRQSSWGAGGLVRSITVSWNDRAERRYQGPEYRCSPHR